MALKRSTNTGAASREQGERRNPVGAGVEAEGSLSIHHAIAGAPSKLWRAGREERSVGQAEAFLIRIQVSTLLLGPELLVAPSSPKRGLWSALWGPVEHPLLPLLRNAGQPRYPRSRGPAPLPGRRDLGTAPPLPHVPHHPHLTPATRQPPAQGLEGLRESGARPSRGRRPGAREAGLSHGRAAAQSG